MYQIYLITNKLNNRMYIGATSRGYKNRFTEHKNYAKDGKSGLLYDDIRKYGISSFKVELIEDDISDEMACDKEIYYIDKYNTFYLSGNGYNMTIGGRGTIGYQFTEKDKQKISESGKGRVFSEERNNKIRQAMLGREYKQEWKENLSKVRKGRFKGKENPFFGKHHTEETKAKIRETKGVKLVERLDLETSEVLEVYDSIIFAGQWVVDNELSKGKPQTCVGRIYKVCLKQEHAKSCYGFDWRFKERLID